MKAKRINKKLVMNKKTVANLSNTDMNNVQGGISAQVCVDLSIKTFCFISQCYCVETVTKCFTECGPGGNAC